MAQRTEMRPKEYWSEYNKRPEVAERRKVASRNQTRSRAIDVTIHRLEKHSDAELMEMIRRHCANKTEKDVAEFTRQFVEMFK